MQVPFLDVAASAGEVASAVADQWTEIVACGWFLNGDAVRAFEGEFAAYSGRDHCIAVSNGLDALRLGLLAVGVGPGSEVIVPAQTFIATWLAVTHVGAKVVPCDVDRATGLMDLEKALDLVGPKTKAVIAVHLFGHAQDLTAFAIECHNRGVHLLEDCAQSHGAVVGNKAAGTFGDIACYSFYPGKNLGAFGDAGAVLVDNESLGRVVRTLANYGSEKKYDHGVIGFNCRMDELQAVVLREKLRRLDDWNSRRQAIAGMYSSFLRTRDDVGIVGPESLAESVWHIFPILVENRDKVAASMKDDGIATLVHYPIIPSQSGAYRGEFGAELYPSAQYLADHEMSLPIGPHLSDEDVSLVLTSLHANL